jgi:hypothetical protein
MTYGKKTWVIPDMYWPAYDKVGQHYVSHEAICLVNPSDEDCHVTITLYFEDREPITGLQYTCGAKRTRHIRTDLMRDNTGNTLPRGLAYAALVECSIPTVVQYTRVDTTPDASGPMTTMAYPID